MLHIQLKKLTTSRHIGRALSIKDRGKGKPRSLPFVLHHEIILKPYECTQIPDVLCWNLHHSCTLADLKDRTAIFPG